MLEKYALVLQVLREMVTESPEFRLEIPAAVFNDMHDGHLV